MTESERKYCRDDCFHRECNEYRGINMAEKDKDIQLRNTVETLSGTVAELRSKLLVAEEANTRYQQIIIGMAERFARGDR